MKRTYSQIDLDERRKIERWRQAGVSVDTIAEKLGRHTDPLSIEHEDLHQVCAHLNATPRKCLGFRTPAEVFRQKLLAANR